MSVTDSMIEAAARALCIDEGWNPDELTHRYCDGVESCPPLWEIKIDAARAALEAALSVAQVEPSPLDASAPPRVYLQIDTDGDDEDRSEPIPESCWEDLTWHHSRIGGQEIEYVRVDRPWSPKVDEDEA